MDANSAAWLNSRFHRLEVGPAPYTAPVGKELVVRTCAVAINPLDRLIQKLGGFLYGWLKYPAVLGTDLAGEVVAIGTDVTRFKIGDRVLALAVGVEKSRNRAAEGAFQHYALVLEHLTAPIPAQMPYEEAAVLPLGLSTAASGMFQKDFLALNNPKISSVATNQTFLVWGGSTSVGSNAIQLAVSAGYTVVTTASPKNFDYVRGLGAAHVFDYNSPKARRDIKKVLKGTKFAGAIAIGNGSAAACVDIAGSCRGNKFVAIATFPVDMESIPERSGSFAVARRVVPKMMMTFAGLGLTALFGGVKSKFIWGSSLMDNEVSRTIFETFLPEALRMGRYVAAPPPVIAGDGLAAIQAGLDLQKKGVSGQKIVVLL